MNLLVGLLVVVAVSAVAIAAMLLVRRHAPDGSYFHDGDRAAGVFGVLATGFALVSGFVIFLAFESYDTSRGGAEAETMLICGKPYRRTTGRWAGSNQRALACELGRGRGSSPYFACISALSAVRLIAGNHGVWTLIGPVWALKSGLVPNQRSTWRSSCFAATKSLTMWRASLIE